MDGQAHGTSPWALTTTCALTLRYPLQCVQTMPAMDNCLGPCTMQLNVDVTEVVVLGS